MTQHVLSWVKLSQIQLPVTQPLWALLTTGQETEKAIGGGGGHFQLNHHIVQLTFIKMSLIVQIHKWIIK